MTTRFSNACAAFEADRQQGVVTGLWQAVPDGMNWLADGAVITKSGFADDADRLLGKSELQCDGQLWDTRGQTPVCEPVPDGLRFTYEQGGLRLQHTFCLNGDAFRWHIGLEATDGREHIVSRMFHWMPVRYVMHESLEENYRDSCSFVPSLSGDFSYAVCRRRDGLDSDLVIGNTGGRMRSTGSLCRYKNLFFEKSAPSLSGLVLMCAVNCDDDAVPVPVDWPYAAMRTPIRVTPERMFADEYAFFFAPNGDPGSALLKHGFPVFRYEPVLLCGRPGSVEVRSTQEPVSCTLLRGCAGGPETEYTGTPVRKGDSWVVCLPPLENPGERKLSVRFADGRQAAVMFMAYRSMREMVEGFCGWIFHDSFVSDPDDPDYAGYRSISRQGEACAKGSVLLMKNLLGDPVPEEIEQVERNAVCYLKKRWLNDDFTAIKQYPGGFARIIDMDYLLMEFYLLSKMEDRYLRLGRADTYLEWAWRVSMYRLQVTPDKLPREAVEVELASMISWLQAEMPGELRRRGFVSQAERLEEVWQRHIQLQLRKVEDGTFVETEHYFDNAGISVVAETLLNSGCVEAGEKAARLLEVNVAPSTDYRNFAPDRWWEALAPMYHNLWAVFSAKALLTAYEKTRNPRYLEPAYRAMMPMFFNYDWNAFSALNRLEKGMGVSAYCLTSPNLNVREASRNRFGQSIFKDDFFDQMDIAGDDWDLGADMVVYLTTFGRTCYVVEEQGELKAVNALLTRRDDTIRVESNAAYPTEYRIDAWDLTIRSNKPGACIRAVTLKNGRCVSVELENEPAGSENPVQAWQAGRPARIG